MRTEEIKEDFLSALNPAWKTSCPPPVTFTRHDVRHWEGSAPQALWLIEQTNAIFVFLFEIGHPEPPPRHPRNVPDQKGKCRAVSTPPIAGPSVKRIKSPL